MERLEAIAGAVWGWPTMILFLVIGIYLTWRTGAVQVRCVDEWLFGTVRGLFRKSDGTQLSPLQSLSTALGGTVGTGNIAGVTAAVFYGGAGALFWMWVAAIIGMAIKYSEVLLAVKYRRKNAENQYVGGAMYYIQYGLPGRYRSLAYLFSFAGAAAAFGIGSSVQSGEIAAALSALNPALDGRFRIFVGIVVSLAAYIVLNGGAKRLGKTTERLVPIMSLCYAFVCLLVLAKYSGRLFSSLLSVFLDAFSPDAGFGACVGWGVRRGIFSNEAGLGSSPIAHAESSERDCVRQGMAGIFEVFVDTIVICTLTGLTLIVSGNDTGATTAQNTAALATVFGGRAAAWILAAGMTLFSFSSLLSWGFYGRRCFEYISCACGIRAYTAMFCAAAFMGAVVRLDALWLVSDVLNAFMAAPNLLSIVLLAQTTVLNRNRRVGGQY